MNKKKHYQKPTLTSVILTPEENVLAVCMDGTGTGEEQLAFCRTGPPEPCLDETAT